MFSLISFGFKDFLDILLVSIIMFQFFKLFKGTQSMNIFVSIFIFIITWLIVKYAFGMELLSAIMDAIMSVGAIIMVVLFQEEIKQSLTTIGNNGIVGRLKRFILKGKEGESDANVDEIISAIENCATTKTGLLIIIKQIGDLSQYINTGEIIDSKISARLIENIFFKNTPLHDGALIISNGKIVSAGCILPVSHNLNIPKHYGLRHRAALGVSEKTDALALIVSEETGHISVARGGNIRSKVTSAEIRDIIKNKK